MKKAKVMIGIVCRKGLKNFKSNYGLPNGVIDIYSILTFTLFLRIIPKYVFNVVEPIFNYNKIIKSNYQAHTL